MKRYSIIIFALCALFLIPVQAQEIKKAEKAEKKEAVKSHLKQHFKPYGFIRNYLTYDSRECVAGTGDMFFYMPKDESWNKTTDPALREDLNAQSSLRVMSLTTRVGLNIVGYQWGRTEFSGKIEADFFAGLSGVTHKVSGVAQFRLRQAYVTLGWDSLPMLSGKDYARVDLTVGQTWHPMAADLCDVIGLNSGAPFGPFNRSPQVRMDARLGKYFTLTAAGLWQVQYMSTGPDGQSAEYITYGKTPEAYLGLSFQHQGWTARVGANVVSIRPRHQGNALSSSSVADTIVGTDGKAVQVSVKDRITTASPFLYLQYKNGEFSVKAKTIFAEAGEHMNMNGGYGVKAVNADGSYEYTPIRTSSSWISLVYGGKVGKQEDKHPQKLQGILFAGYSQNLGTKDALATDAAGKLIGLYSVRAKNLNSMWRITPTLLYTVGKFQLGLEYDITSVHYSDGKLDAANGLSVNGLHWVTNHRVQIMTKYNF